MALIHASALNRGMFYRLGSAVIAIWAVALSHGTLAADSTNGARAAIEPKVAELVGLVGTGRVDAMPENG